MRSISLPEFVADRPAVEVDAALRLALQACDRARECAVLWFAEVQRRELYRAFGHASLQVYATAALGFSQNRYWQFKRLADDLDRLPMLREAVASGDVGWTKAQQVARVATPATQAAWVAKAAVTGRRELAQEVRQLCRRKSGVVQSGVVQSGAVQSGATASLFAEPAPAPTEPVTASINLRGDALQVARFEALLEKAQKLGLVPAGADRLDAVLAGLEALVSGQTASTAGPATQIIIHQCPDCGSAATVTRRGELPLAPAQVATAACDARICRAGGVNRATIPPKTRAVVLARDRHRCSTPGCGATHFLEVHHVVSRARGGSNRAENLMTLCGRCHRFHHERDEGALVPAQVLSAQVANAQVLRPQVENAQAANAQAANAQAASAPRCDLERHQGRR